MVNGRHVCSCPICRLAALQAAARNRAAPASRRDAALSAASEATGHIEKSEVPCYSSQCDHSGDFPGTRPGTEPFALPRIPTLSLDAVAMDRGDVTSAPATRDALPEVPPPRSGRS